MSPGGKAGREGGQQRSGSVCPPRLLLKPEDTARPLSSSQGWCKLTQCTRGRAGAPCAAPGARAWTPLTVRRAPPQPGLSFCATLTASEGPGTGPGPRPSLLRALVGDRAAGSSLTSQPRREPGLPVDSFLLYPRLASVGGALRACSMDMRPRPRRLGGTQVHSCLCPGPGLASPGWDGGRSLTWRTRPWATLIKVSGPQHLSLGVGVEYPLRGPRRCPPLVCGGQVHGHPGQR